MIIILFRRAGLRRSGTGRWIAALTLSALLPGGAAFADTYIVTNASDGGPNTLREALTQMAASDSPPHHISIDVPENQNTLLIATPLPDIQGSHVTITAEESPGFTLHGLSFRQILRASSGVKHLEIRDLRLMSGVSTRGACLDLALDDDSVIRLLRVEFEDCEAVDDIDGGRGGAVHVSNAQRLEVIDSRFRFNFAVGNNRELLGGAIHTAARELVIEDSLFETNGVSDPFDPSCGGGAVSMVETSGQPSSATISGTRFIDNFAGCGANSHGGALMFDCVNCAVDISDSYFTLGLAAFGGALSVVQSQPAPLPTTALRNVTMYRNTAAGSGGAIHIRRGALELRNVTLQDNEAWAGTGEAQAGSHLAADAGLVLPVVANTVFGAVGPKGTGSSCDAVVAATAAGIGGGNLFADDSCADLAADGALQMPADERGVLDESDAARPVLVFAREGSTTDAGDNVHCTGLDARGRPRPQDGNGDHLATCDVGAVEHPRWLPVPVFGDGFEAGRSQ